MATIINMPKLSDTMEEGGIAKWLKKEGQEVSEGEALLEIETDKATMEYSSPEEGILLKILVEAGKSVALNEPIAVVGANGESFDLAELLAKRKKGTTKTSAEAGVTRPQETIPAPASISLSESAPVLALPVEKKAGRIKASPLARKIAKDRGLDISSLRGSGPNGRIIMKDIGLSPQRDSPTLAPNIPGDQIIPLSMMRKTIAKRLLAGKNDAPHFYLTVSANMEQVISWRRDLNRAKGVAEGQVAKVSVNDIIVMAASRALRLHPTVNSSWNTDSILQHGAVHICIAVALPTGLVTPALRNVDQLGVRQIAGQTKFFGEKARLGQLTNDDFKDGTFTVSNLGMTGIEEFTAIINPPQACILAVGKTMLQPWVSENGSIIAQNRMKMTLSCDHRVVDGMVGAKFLETLVQFLESPLMMFS